MIPKPLVLASFFALACPLLAKGIEPAPGFTEWTGGKPLPGRWDSLLVPIWEGWKQRFVSHGQVSAPGFGSRSRYQSSGMLLALWFGDQAAFDTIWQSTESQQWDASRRLYKEYRSSNEYEYSAEFNLDMAGALLSAKALVDAKLWIRPPEGSAKYLERASQILTSVSRELLAKDPSTQILPLPAASHRRMSDQPVGWTPTFRLASQLESIPWIDKDRLDAGMRDLLLAQTGSSYGMIHNASTALGMASSDCPTCTPNSQDMGSEALRAVWHLATAIRWNPNLRPSLVAWARGAWKAGKVDPHQPGMYTAQQMLLRGWENGSYAHFSSRALWGSLAAAAQDSADTAEAAHKAFHAILDDLQESMVPGVGFLVDGDTSSSAPVRMDLEAQTMGLLGLLSMTNNTPDIYSELHSACCAPDPSSISRPETARIRIHHDGLLLRLDRDRAGIAAGALVVRADGRSRRIPRESIERTADGLVLRLDPSPQPRWILVQDDLGRTLARAALPPSW